MTTEVLVRFTEPVRSASGQTFEARACGAPMSDGLWHGWIELVPTDGGAPIRTPRETEQPNRDDLTYWAQGLSAAYLEGALVRALAAAAGPPVVAARAERSLFAGPARDPAVPVVVDTHAVLDPFAVLAEGAEILRRQLLALSRDQLRNIVRAYGLDDRGLADPASGATDREVVERIVADVRRRAAGA